jgi:hypothetical protein
MYSNLVSAGSEDSGLDGLVFEPGKELDLDHITGKGSELVKETIKYLHERGMHVEIQGIVGLSGDAIPDSCEGLSLVVKCYDDAKRDATINELERSTEQYMSIHKTALTGSDSSDSGVRRLYPCKDENPFQRLDSYRVEDIVELESDIVESFVLRGCGSNLNLCFEATETYTVSTVLEKLNETINRSLIEAVGPGALAYERQLWELSSQKVA